MRVAGRCTGALALLLAIAACGSGEETDSITVTGYVEATDVRVASKIGGTLEWFPLEEGDRVQAGQEVARIDTTDLQLQLRSARAERQLAATDLQLKQAGYRPEEIAEADARRAQAQAELEAAQKELDRFQSLVDLGSGTTKARDDALARRNVAARALEGAEARLARLQAGFRAEEIAGARARIDVAEARMAQLEQQISDATVRSPAAGTITAKLVEPGEVLGPGAPLFVLTDLAGAWLTAYLPEPDLGRVHIGQQARVTTDDGRSRDGVLSFVNDQAEFTPKNIQTRDERVTLVYRIKVRLPNDDGMFKPGMPAEALFDTPVDAPAGSPPGRAGGRP